MVNIMTLSGRTIGLIVAPGFDDAQVTRVTMEMRLRGAEAVVIGLGESEAVAVSGKKGSLLKPDTTLINVHAGDLDALIIPGGDSVEHVAQDERILTLLLEMHNANKPLAAIGNGPIVLAAAGLVADRRITGSEDIRKKVEESAAHYEDLELVVDHKLVTSGTAEEITHFMEAVALLLEPAGSLN